MPGKLVGRESLLCDRAVRVELGIPRSVAAKLAGVSRNTLRLYEIDPIGVVGPITRAACAALYEDLRGLLHRAELRRVDRDARHG